MLWGMGRLLLPGPQGLGHSASAEIAAQAPLHPCQKTLLTHRQTGCREHLRGIGPLEEGFPKAVALEV